MKRFTKVILLSMFLCFAYAGSTFALSLTFNDVDTGDFLYVEDQGAGDGHIGLGVVSSTASVGNWGVNVTTGLSYPVIGASDKPELDLNSVNVTSGQLGGTLEILLEDTYDTLGEFNDSITGFQFAVGGTTRGTVDYKVYVNDVLLSDVFIDQGPAFAYSDLMTPIPGELGDELTLKILATIVHTAAGQVTSFDAHLTPIPEPASIALFGIGLLGFAGIARRKR